VNAPNGTPLYFEPISGHCYASLEEVRRNYFVLGSAGLGVEDAYAHYIRARQLAQEGFPFLARQDFEEAIQKAPSLTLAYASLAKSLEVLGETSEALRVLDTAISKNPQPYFLRQRAYFKYELKDYEGALKDIQACLESDPRYPNALSLEKFLLSKLK
jgi:tetratricopeptide (TPR) repeat protein